MFYSYPIWHKLVVNVTAIQCAAMNFITLLWINQRWGNSKPVSNYPWTPFEIQAITVSVVSTFVMSFHPTGAILPLHKTQNRGIRYHSHTSKMFVERASKPFRIQKKSAHISSVVFTLLANIAIMLIPYTTLIHLKASSPLSRLSSFIRPC